MSRRISCLFIAFLLMVSVIFQGVSYAKVQSVVHRDTILVQYLFNSSTIFKICATMSL